MEKFARWGEAWRGGIFFRRAQVDAEEDRRPESGSWTKRKGEGSMRMNLNEEIVEGEKAGDEGIKLQKIK